MEPTNPSSAPEDSRRKWLTDYKELQDGLEYMLQMQQEQGGEDEDLRTLVADARAQLKELALQLNSGERIEVTPSIEKVVLPGVNGEEPVILFPCDGTLSVAPYEVHYDERAWYACVITGVVLPSSPTERIRYKAWILGYNVEEVVFSESLRPWQPSNTEGLRSGVECHAIHPHTGMFAPAVVERLTLEGTAMVCFTSPPSISPSTTKHTDIASTMDGEEAQKHVLELPLSHVRVGQFYKHLCKRVQLSEEERQRRRAENARKKRERIEEEKQLKADMVAQDANDWRSLMGEMMGTSAGPAKKRRLV